MQYCEKIKPLLTYGIDNGHADVRAANLRQQGFEMLFDLKLPGREETLPVTLNLPGRHNALNALAAAAIGWRLARETEHGGTRSTGDAAP